MKNETMNWDVESVPVLQITVPRGKWRWLIKDMVKQILLTVPAHPPGQIMYSDQADCIIIRPGGLRHTLNSY